MSNIKNLIKNKQLIFLIILVLLMGLVFVSQLLTPKKKISRRPKASEVITFSFDPSSVTAANNVDFTLTIKATPPSAMTIQLYKININFDKSKVKIKDNGINYLVGQPSIALGADDNSKINNINGDSGQGTIKLYGEIINPITGLVINGPTDLARIAFTSKVDNAYTITNSDSSVSKVNADYTVVTVPLSNAIFNVNSRGNITVTPTTPPTLTPSGNITLNLKLKFQGILSKSAAATTMPVRIKIGGIMLPTPTEYKTAVFTVDDNGVWNGSVSFNLTPGSGYIVYIKGPKHLQKKICATVPTETSPGTYRCARGDITLAAGNNTLDFSNIYQLVGDLPEQDGIVNSYDTSLVQNNLGKTDAEALRLADLNLDGRVDTQDYSLVIAALSVRADEE